MQRYSVRKNTGNKISERFGPDAYFIIDNETRRESYTYGPDTRANSRRIARRWNYNRDK